MTSEENERTTRFTVRFGVVELLLGDVQIVHVGSVMFLVVKFHDFT